MKFGKEFVSQMVPEWQEAYMDYSYLKSQLKDIQLSNQRNKPSSTPRSLMRRSTLYRTFSGLTRRNSNNKNSNVCIHNTNQGGDVEDQVILVSVVNPKGSEGLYETMFLMSTDEGGQNELVFFRKLDAEFNKVNKFYRSKVEEVMEEATSLNKQMDALIAFRFKVEGDGKKYDLAAEMNCLASDVAASAASVSASSPRCPRASDEDRSSIWDSNEILTRVKINKTNGTPYSTLKGLLKVDGEKGLNFRRESLEKIENQLKCAFVEFYQKLRLLKNYSFLNLMAFSKIMKKYDKVSSRKASKAYLNTVDNSYIGSSDEVTRLVQKVEDTYIKHFSNSNRSKGMRTLRPKSKKEYHSTTFSSGFLTGCTAALLIALILIFHVQKILKKEGFEQYMQNMFPLYSLFGFIVIHMVMYAGNVYYWRRYRVNYSFIFGFKQGTELGYREVLLLSTGLSTLALASVFANLDMEINEHTKDYKAMTELIPLGLLTLLLLITVCPFNIIYRSSRFFLLSSLFRGFCAPLYKVTLPDFFLQDQLTSQIQALRSLEFYICYYGWGDFTQRRNMCRSNNIYNIFNFIVATIPYWSRLLQCVRRLCEDRDRMHGYNALKYFSTIVAVVTRTAYSQRRGQVWWIVALVSSGIATIYGTYWDIIVDWGLLQRHAKNRWLRDKLILPNKSVYFGAMVLNIVLRLAWLQTVLNFQVSFLRRETLLAIAASLEIIRRGIWNFFRLENEHLNNVGKYRAFKSVPLPFNYDENDDRDD